MSLFCVLMWKQNNKGDHARPPSVNGQFPPTLIEMSNKGNAGVFQCCWSGGKHVLDTVAPLHFCLLAISISEEKVGF